MITYSTWPGATPARSSAALMAAAPRAVAGKVLRLPSSRPIGVRAPPTITEVIVSFLRTSAYLAVVQSDYRREHRTGAHCGHHHRGRDPAHRPRRDRRGRSRRGHRTLRPRVRLPLRTHRGEPGAGGTRGHAHRRRRARTDPAAGPAALGLADRQVPGPQRA